MWLRWCDFAAGMLLWSIANLRYRRNGLRTVAERSANASRLSGRDVPALGPRIWREGKYARLIRAIAFLLFVAFFGWMLNSREVAPVTAAPPPVELTVEQKAAAEKKEAAKKAENEKWTRDVLAVSQLRKSNKPFGCLMERYAYDTGPLTHSTP